jgi:hypothetical protein
MVEVADWTLGSLKEYIERRFNDQAKAIDAALAAAEKAVTKAEVATEKRFDSVNEFRKTLSDQAGSFMQRGEFVAQHKSLEEKVSIYSRTQNMLVGGLILLSFVEPIIVAVLLRWKN